MRALVVSVLILIVLLSAGCQQKDSPRGVLARIDGTVVTVEDFNQRFQELKLETQFSPGGHESVMEMKEEFLDQLIEEALILKTAKQLGIAVPEEALEKEIMETKNDYKGESLREYLNSQGISFEDWREGVKRRMLIEKTIRMKSQYDGVVSKEEARAYYEAHGEEYVIPERVRVRQIVVTSQREANRILRELEDGKPFEKLAVSHSLGPESRFGGDLGYFSRGDMPREFDVVFSMDVGEVSKAVKSPYGHHIFKVEDRTPGHQLAFEDVVESVKRKITQTKSEERYYQWLGELKAEAKVKINRHLLEYTD